jgi:hypothetical protein
VVRVNLSRADVEVLKRVVAEEARIGGFSHPFGRSVSDVVWKAAAGEGPFELDAATFETVPFVLGTAMVRNTIGPAGVADIQEILRAFERAGATTASRCARRRSDGMQSPARVGWTDVPQPSVEELREAGWRDLPQFRERYRDDRLGTYDLTTDAAVEHLHLHGLCGAFAVAVQDMTGWDMVAVRLPWEDVPRHVACRTPDGLFVDARGDDLTGEELAAGYYRWAGVMPDIHEIDREEVVRTFRRHPHQYVEAREAVERLLPGLAEAMAPRR